MHVKKEEVEITRYDVPRADVVWTVHASRDSRQHIVSNFSIVCS